MLTSPITPTLIAWNQAVTFIEELSRKCYFSDSLREDAKAIYEYIDESNWEPSIKNVNIVKEFLEKVYKGYYFGGWYEENMGSYICLRDLKKASL